MERVLSRLNSGMTLLECLQRDPVLREDLVSLLRDFEQLEIVDQLVTVADKTRKRTRPESGFDQADQANATTYRPVLPAWDSKQEEKFEKYYGAHPSNCEGARYFGNSEQQDCFVSVTGTSFDVTPHQPVCSNIPQINVLLDGKWKCRALVDSGSTSTMLSSGLLRLMGNLKDSMHTTSFGFFGVGEEQLKFSGIFYNMSVQLTDISKTVVPCAVYENTQPVRILGNDLIGGINSVFSIVGHAALYSCYLLQDGALNLDVLPLIKNVEGIGFPPEPKANMAKAGNEQNSVYGIFRRS